MSLISQFAVVILIIIIAAILFYANKGLETAEQEGERFVDEWKLKQQYKEKQKRGHEVDHVSGSLNSYPDHGTNEEAESDEIEEESARRMKVNRESSSVSLCDRDLSLNVYDEKKNKIGKVQVDHYPYLIGRNPKNDLILNDLYIAQFHCEIVEKDGEFLLKDRGSVNKIYADGKNVSEYILRNQSSFYLGGYELTVEIRQHRSHPTVLATRAEREVYDSQT